MALVAVRVVGASAADDVRVLSSTCIETQRPRTTLKKSFEVDVVLGAELSTAECHEAATRASLREAVDNGRSVVVLALGSEKSGKSTSVRGGGDGSEGIALLTARDIFAALGEMSAQPDDVVAETMVTVSAALNAITPALGETALMGKQPVRERLVDALGPSSSEQPLAGLNIREHADGLPHAATFFAEGLREVEVKSAVASLGAVDPSRLKLLKKAQPRRFVPAAGSRALAQHDNGEWYDARITATSRAEDGSARYVVKFDEDGLVQHLLLERLRAPNAA